MSFLRCLYKVGCLILLLLNGLYASGSNEHEPQLIRGPYLQAATSTSITIRWRTDAAEQEVERY